MPELVAEVDREMGHSQPMTRVARRPHGLGRAARPLAVRRLGIDPEPQRDADRAHTRRRSTWSARRPSRRHRSWQRRCGRGGLQTGLRDRGGERRVQGVDCELGARPRRIRRRNALVHVTPTEPGGVEQVAPLGQPAGELRRRGCVRAGECPVAGDGDSAPSHPEARSGPRRRTPGSRRRRGARPGPRRRPGRARARGRRRRRSTPARRLRSRQRADVGDQLVHLGIGQDAAPVRHAHDRGLPDDAAQTR